MAVHERDARESLKGSYAGRFELVPWNRSKLWKCYEADSGDDAILIFIRNLRLSAVSEGYTCFLFVEVVLCLLH
jgi:hypothetical protein